MAENKVNWNTVLVVLVIGVVGILLLNSGILTGNVTGSIDNRDKQIVLTMLNKVQPKNGNVGESCNTVCSRDWPGSTCITSSIVFTDNKVLPVACDTTQVNGYVTCRCAKP